MRFADRTEAGRRLAEKLRHLAGSALVVLALPRGGVPVGLEVARALGAPLDLVLVRKIGAPGQPELAAGAVADGETPHTVINQRVVHAFGMSEAEIAEAAAREVQEIERRRQLWMQGRKRIPVSGRTVIVVDDGIATGASVQAALKAMQDAGAAHRIVAAPVAPAETAESLRKLCDEAVFLLETDDFLSVGGYYQDFHQLDDAEITELLERARTPGQPRGVQSV